MTPFYFMYIDILLACVSIYSAPLSHLSNPQNNPYKKDHNLFLLCAPWIITITYTRETC